MPDNIGYLPHHLPEGPAGIIMQMLRVITQAGEVLATQEIHPPEKGFVRHTEDQIV